MTKPKAPRDYDKETEDLLESAYDLVACELSKLERLSKGSPEAPGPWKLGDLASLLKTTHALAQTLKAARSSQGATDSPIDFSRLSLEELEQLATLNRKLYGDDYDDD